MVRAFDFKIDANGTRIVVARLPLTPDCPDGDAIDDAIEALKDDLDATAAKMKAALRPGSPKGPPEQVTKPQATVIPLPPRPI
jgi:hypothetical protein